MVRNSCDGHLFFTSEDSVAFQYACREPTCLAVEDAGGAAQHQDGESSQQDKGVYRACGGSGSHGMCGSLRRRYDGGADRCSDGACQLLQGVDDSVAVAAQFLREGAKTVGHGRSYGKSLSQSEEDIESGNHQNAAFVEEQGEADCRNNYRDVACEDRLLCTDAI